MKNNQKGFGAIELFLIVMAVLVVGAAGYYVWSRNKKTDLSPKTTNSANSTVSSGGQSEPQGDVFTIDEWKVTMTIPKAFKISEQSRVVYAFGKDHDTVLLFSDLQGSLPTSCSFSSSNDGLDGPWGIVREKPGTVVYPNGDHASDAELSNNSAYVRLGDYYYHRTYPQMGCTDIEARVNTLDTAYKDLFASIKTE